jgi:hypothetical protein
MLIEREACMKRLSLPKHEVLDNFLNFPNNIGHKGALDLDFRWS